DPGAPGHRPRRAHRPRRRLRRPRGRPGQHHHPPARVAAHGRVHGAGEQRLRARRGHAVRGGRSPRRRRTVRLPGDARRRPRGHRRGRARRRRTRHHHVPRRRTGRGQARRPAVLPAARPGGGRRHLGGRVTRTRRVTIRDVAVRAGVSVATVSRVLGGDYPVLPATRNKVMRAVRELDYVPNAHARALSASLPGAVAIVVNSVAVPYYAYIAQGVEEQAALEGRLSLICTTGGDTGRELAIMQMTREQRAEAVILVGSVIVDEEYRQRMAEYAHSLDAAGSRLVLCGRPPLGEGVPALVVGFDNTGGAYAVTA